MSDDTRWAAHAKARIISQRGRCRKRGVSWQDHRDRGPSPPSLPVRVTGCEGCGAALRNAQGACAYCGRGRELAAGDRPPVTPTPTGGKPRLG